MININCFVLFYDSVAQTNDRLIMRCIVSLTWFYSMTLNSVSGLRFHVSWNLTNISSGSSRDIGPGSVVIHLAANVLMCDMCL